MGPIAPSSLTIDIDTGGTFTDGFISGPEVEVQVKADTTPHDLTLGILACIDQAAEMLAVSRRALLAATRTVRLSTTVGTNALINGTGPTLGLLVGPELHARPDAFATLPVRADLVAAVDTAGHDQVAVVKQLLERGARLIVIALDGDAGAALAVAENRLRELIALEYPRHYLGAVPVLTSHEVTRTPDAAARLRTAVLDAYLHPLMSRFLYRVEDELRREGYRHPLLIGNADGGSSRVAKTTAIRTWGSGPAGAVAGAAHLARTLQVPALLTLDVGGTSSDIALISDGRWRYVVEPQVAGVAVAVPLLELQSVGIGGGSIVRVADGRITVGPDSAGAQPGPAAFGLGGEDATLTDAFCCLGVFDPANFLGGRKKLDVDASVRVFTRVAQQLGLGVSAAAATAIQAAAAKVAAGIRELLTHRQVESAEVELLAGGGAGGLLGCWVMAAAGLKATRAFPLAPVFSAYGLSVLDRMHSYELTAESRGLADRIDTALQRAQADMRSEGVDPAQLRFEIEVEFGSDGSASAETLGAITTGGEGAQLVAARGESVRLVRLRASTATSAPPPAPAMAGTAAPFQRSVYWDDADTRDHAATETTVHAWSSLRPDTQLSGPALVEGGDTTVVLPPGFTALVGDYSDLLITASNPGV